MKKITILLLWSCLFLTPQGSHAQSPAARAAAFAKKGDDAIKGKLWRDAYDNYREAFSLVRDPYYSYRMVYSFKRMNGDREIAETMRRLTLWFELLELREQRASQRKHWEMGRKMISLLAQEVSNLENTTASLKFENERIIIHVKTMQNRLDKVVRERDEYRKQLGSGHHALPNIKNDKLQDADPRPAVPKPIQHKSTRDEER